MNILGIDPGIGRMGWGIIEKEKGNVTVIDYGCLETDQKNTVENRLLAIHEFLQELIKIHRPAVMAVEELFFNTNVKTALTVGQARGVILLSAAQQQVSVSTYTPLQIKIAIAGYGRAEKRQVGQMVKATLKLKEIPKPDDTADALAIALTHAFSMRIKK